MTTLFDGVRKFNNITIFLFAFSKVLVGIGIGTLLADMIGSFAWTFLGFGIIISLVCIIIAMRNSE